MRGTLCFKGLVATPGPELDAVPLLIGVEDGSRVGRAEPERRTGTCFELEETSEEVGVFNADGDAGTRGSGTYARSAAASGTWCARAPGGMEGSVCGGRDARRGGLCRGRARCEGFGTRPSDRRLVRGRPARRRAPPLGARASTGRGPGSGPSSGAPALSGGSLALQRDGGGGSLWFTGNGLSVAVSSF